VNWREDFVDVAFGPVHALFMHLSNRQRFSLSSKNGGHEHGNMRRRYLSGRIKRLSGHAAFEDDAQLRKVAARRRRGRSRAGLGRARPIAHRHEAFLENRDSCLMFKDSSDAAFAGE